MRKSGLHSGGFPTAVGRRSFLGGAAVAVLAPLAGGPAWAKKVGAPTDLAWIATPSSSYAMGRVELSALNAGTIPASSADAGGGALRILHSNQTDWVDYAWAAPLTIDAVEVYWFAEGSYFAMPASYRLLYWNGADFVPVLEAEGYGRDRDRFNRTTFSPVRTQRLRLEIVGGVRTAVGLSRWRAFGPAPILPPRVEAGIDRTLIVGGRTYLSGVARALNAVPAALWHAASGPGAVAFADAQAAQTTAAAGVPGDYTLRLRARGAGGTTQSSLRLRVEPPPPAERLDVVYTTPYALTSPFWLARAKALIVNWIPHCIRFCERTDLKEGAGGLDNFIEAAKALRGQPHGKHKGFVFSNAWVHQTVEAMCIALMVDAGGDRDILAAQTAMRATLEKWIPIVLAAQEPDGYLQTAYTLAERKDWPERWSPAHRSDHEGYVSGYFIESAINHYTLTGGKDRRLYAAAKKLADCWCAHLGPGKQPWFDGHQEMEQALVRFGRFVNDVEGGGHGDAYIALARFLLESRQGGTEYDQSHLPPAQQYEAVGHAVRAMYFYSGMADIAAETGDRDYQSAVMSLWDNMTNRKYYVTGGVGSGDTAEGFGRDYALRNDAYCESCSSCGLIFFQYKLNLAYRHARFADLYEETLYNALLGSLDLEGKHFTYTNPLEDVSPRYEWHDCPCCVGNIARTLLMLPTWTYAKAKDAVFVNLFIGSRIDVGTLAGTRVEMVQKTDYPWKGAVAITVNPQAPRDFSVYVRVPHRATSALYAATPTVCGLHRLSVNGQPVEVAIENGYAVVTRRWQAGDTIAFELPLAVQKIAADAKVEADRGKVALRYGPLLYNVETADQPRIDRPLSDAPLAAVWRPDLLGGVMAIAGTWRDGAPMLAIPNYARMNRAGPGTESPVAEAVAKTLPVVSKVWIET